MESLIVLILIIAFTYYVYRQKRSVLWAAGAFILGTILMPMVVDQFSAFFKKGGEPKNLTNTTIASTSCNCK